MDGDSLEKIGRDYAINFGRLDAMNEAERDLWPDAPERIYLQVCPDGEECGESYAWHKREADDGLTWCQDKINETDIEYVRARTTARPPALSDEQITKLWRDASAHWGGMTCVQKFARAILAASREPAPEEKS